MKSKTTVFIHGLFMNPESWGSWINYFEMQGFRCYARIPISQPEWLKDDFYKCSLWTFLI